MASLSRRSSLAHSAPTGPVARWSVAPRTIGDYDPTFGPLREARKQRSGNQVGDPVKAAHAMLKVIETQKPPGHLLLGQDAVTAVREKLNGLLCEITDWEKVSLATAFD